MDILKVGEWNVLLQWGWGLSVGQKFQESLAQSLQDMEDDQYLGGQGAFPINGASRLHNQVYH